MSDTIQVEVGAVPWLPAASAEAVVEYQYYELPTCGIVRQRGIDYLFTCLVGQEEPVNFWIYKAISGDQRQHLESAGGLDEFNERLHNLAPDGLAVMALATDATGILGWHDYQPAVPGALQTAADQLAQWFIHAAELAKERSEELAAVPIPC